jgi:hypothetical protein
VQACYQSACSGWSATATVAVLLPPSSSPTISGAGISANGSFTLTWTSVPTATSYAVYYIASSSNWVLEQNTAATSYSGSQGANGNYQYVVVACNGGGCGPTNASVWETVAFPPTTAPTLSVAIVSTPVPSSLDSSWTAVTNATSYTLQESKNGGAWSTVVSALPGTTYTVSPGSGTFAFQVQGCSAGGCGPWSATVTVHNVQCNGIADACASIKLPASSDQ